MHRDTKVWGPTANKFIPERWAEGAGAPKPGSFFPFSYGPRNCLGEFILCLVSITLEANLTLLTLGQGLAMLEMSLALATLFRRYDLAFEDGFQMEFLPSFTLCAKNGLRVRVARRTA